MTGGLVRLRCREARIYVQVTTDVRVSPVGSLWKNGCLDTFNDRGPYDRKYGDNVNTHLLLPLGAL